jgi:hypothetical protein
MPGLLELAAATPAPSPATVERLNPDNSHDIRGYEEAFYQAFLPIDNPGIREIWLWDDAARRLRTKVSYSEQQILITRSPAGIITGGLAFNTAGRVFQSAEYGFDRPAAEPPWVEVLTSFHTATDRLLARRVAGHARCLLAAHGASCAYGTCSARILKVRQRAGWQSVAERHQHGVTRFLIRCCDLARFV